MRPTRHVLIVAYYFPPIGGIGSIRLARFAELLPEHGWEATVLAPSGTPHAPDPQLTFPEERVVRARSLELSQVGRVALRARPRATEVPGTLGASSVRAGVRDAAHRYVFFPDPQIGWYPCAVAAGRRLLRRARFDAVYSSAYPITAHLIARTLSRRARLPWVAEYRDPWSDRLFADHPYTRAADALERRIARDAARIVMPSQSLATFYGDRWETDVAAIPNGHDGRLPPRRTPEHPTLTYIGTYHPGEQDLETIWRALGRLRNGEVPRIRFVGHLPDRVRTDVAAAGVADALEPTGFVSHDEAMRELMSSSVLLASGVLEDQPYKRGNVPAKLFEYLASGLPIVYVSQPDTDAARLLRGRPGCHVVTPGDVDGALAAVRAALVAGDVERDVADLSRTARTRLLADVLDRAAA